MATALTDRRLVAAVLLALGALLVVPLLFGGGMMAGGGMWGRGAPAVPGWMVLLGTLSQVLVVVVLAGAGYLLYRAVTDGGGDSALEELRSAYARGDLSDEEYERRRERLRREE